MVDVGPAPGRNIASRVTCPADQPIRGRRTTRSSPRHEIPLSVPEVGHLRCEESADERVSTSTSSSCMRTTTVASVLAAPARRRKGFPRPAHRRTNQSCAYSKRRFDRCRYVVEKSAQLGYCRRIRARQAPTRRGFALLPSASRPASSDWLAAGHTDGPVRTRSAHGTEQTPRDRWRDEGVVRTTIATPFTDQRDERPQGGGIWRKLAH
jgi:hypothetical protein